MAVGTVLGASFWSAWTAKEAAQEHYRSIKVRVVQKIARIFINFTDMPVLWGWLLPDLIRKCGNIEIKALHMAHRFHMVSNEGPVAATST